MWFRTTVRWSTAKWRIFWTQWQEVLIESGIYMTWRVSSHSSTKYRNVYTTCYTSNEVRRASIYTRFRHQHLKVKAMKGNYIIFKMTRKRLHIRKHDKWVITKRTLGLKIVKQWSKGNVQYAKIKVENYKN